MFNNVQYYCQYSQDSEHCEDKTVLYWTDSGGDGGDEDGMPQGRPWQRRTACRKGDPGRDERLRRIARSRRGQRQMLCTEATTVLYCTDANDDDDNEMAKTATL